MKRGLEGEYLTRAATTILPVRSRTFQWITPFLFLELVHDSLLSLYFLI